MQLRTSAARPLSASTPLIEGNTMPRITKATELSNALAALADRDRQIEELKAAHASMVANRNNLFAEREELYAKLDVARKFYVEQRNTIHALRAVRAIRGTPTDTQRAYHAAQMQRSEAFAKERAARAERAAKYFEAHPGAKSVTHEDLVAWEQSIEA
jgi:hypothetical protein